MTTERSTTRPALAALGILALTVVASLATLRGPAPLPSTASPDRFSAERAMAELARVMRVDVARTPGSAEHAASRDRIAARLKELGYRTEIQSTFTCSDRGACAPVQNIIGIREGKLPGPGVLVVSHYDSIPAGPGASDAAAGVATLLETARALGAGQQQRRVTFLITDGEEIGLLGARAFVAEARYRELADVVVNVENRGTSGPSYLFETSKGNGALIPIVAGALDRPATSSLFITIYELLPNDTDLSVFKRAGMAGVNFAGLRDPWAYHTPRDEMRRVNHRTLQHHGDNVLAMVRALAARPTPESRANRVHFDVLSLGVVSWPERFSLPFSLALLLASLVFFVMSLREAWRGALMLPATIALSGGVAALLIAIALLRAGTVKWIAQPAPVLTAIWLASIAVTALLSFRFCRWSSPRAIATANAVWWSAIAFASSATIPGASYLFIVPAFAMLVASAAYRNSSRAGNVIALAAGLFAAVIWVPVILVLYEALATPALLATAVLVVLVVSPGAQLLAPLGQRMAAATLAAGFALAIAAVFLPATTDVRPKPLNLVLVSTEGSPTRWFASGVTSEIKQATPFDTRPRAIIPWSPGSSGYVGDAIEFRFPPPDVSVSQPPGNSSSRTVVVRSNRNAGRVNLWFNSATPIEVRANGVTVRPQNAGGDWKRVSVAAREATFDLTSTSGFNVEAYGTDVEFGLPAAARHVVDARDRSAAVPIQDGDVSVAARRIVIK